MGRDGAAALLDATLGQASRLDPVLIRGGAYKGKYDLPERLKTAEEFKDNRDASSQMRVVTLDCEEALPPEEDESVAMTLSAERLAGGRSATAR